jgi:hypothetical protein
MTVDDTMGSLTVQRLAERLAGESEERHWSACACLWARVFVETRAGWDRWPEQYDIGLRALGHALARATGQRCLSDDRAAVLEAVRDRPVTEDDGSNEWLRAMDFFEMVELALDGVSAQQCLMKAAQVYLEEVFHLIGRTLAPKPPAKVISYADAKQRVPADRRWSDAVNFIGTF